MKQNYWTYNKPLSMTGLGGGATSFHAGGGEEQFWVSTFGDVSAKQDFISRSIDVDSAGNVYTIGQFMHDPGVYNQAYTDDVVLLKWDKNGTIQWQRTIGSTQANKSDRGYTVKIGSTGDIYFSGYSFHISTGQSGASWLIGKFNSAGTLQWMRIVGSTGSEDLYNMTIDSSDNIYCCGMGSGTLSYSSSFGLLMKYNSSGVQQWVRYFGFTANFRDISIYSVAVNGSGDYHMVGTSQEGGYGTFVAKYDSSNTRYWHENWNSGASGGKMDVALDSSGNVYVVNHVSSGQDIGITKYDSGGTQQWHKRIYSQSGFSLHPRAMDMDSSGNFYITGAGYIEPNQDGQFDVMILKINNSGVTILSQLGLGVASSQSNTGTNTRPLYREDEGFGIKVTDDIIYLCGKTESLDTNSTSNSGGGQDHMAFVAKIPNDNGATLTGTYDVSANSGSNSLRYMSYGGLGTVGGVTYSPTSQTTDYAIGSDSHFFQSKTFFTGDASSNVTDNDASSSFDISTTLNFNPTRYALDGVTGYTTGQHPAFP